MKQCIYNNQCIKLQCDLACKEYSEALHWMNRCDLSVSNLCFQSPLNSIIEASLLWDDVEANGLRDDSDFLNIAVCNATRLQQTTDLLAYVAIFRNFNVAGLYNGVYKLNFFKYLEDLKSSWSMRGESKDLEKKQVWIEASKYLVISNLSLVRFGDFESQTLLNILQNRSERGKYTIIVLEKGKYGLPKKEDSIFYSKLRHELKVRGANL